MHKNIIITLRLIFGCILIFQLLSCEKEISIDIGDFEPKIVVNALFQGGDKWEVNVFKSKNVLSTNSDIILEKAKVRITERDTKKSYLLYNIGEGLYTNDSEIIRSGVEYEINVSFPGLQSIRASAFVPDLIDASVIHSETMQFNGKLALRVDFEISDNPFNNNFYIYEILNLFPNAPQDPNGTPFLESPIKSWLSSVDGNTGYISDSSEKQSKLFITDNNFRGSILNTSLVSFVEIQELDHDVPGTIDKSKYVPDFSKSKLKVTAASIEMFEYYKSLELVIQKKALNSSISTPIKPYSNIENGLGIFAGYSSIILAVE